MLRYSPVGLLAALILLMVTAPLMDDFQQGNLVESIFVTLVMVSAVPATGARRSTLILAMFLVTPPLIGKWVHHFWPDLLPPAFPLVTSGFFLGFVMYQLLRSVLRSPRVDARALCAGISAYLLLGFLWSVIYRLVAIHNPGAFVFSSGPQDSRNMNGFNSIYFSFSTLCTVGYGDISPASKAARMLAVVKAITGLFYVTIFIARLVAIYTSAANAGRAIDGEEES